MPYLTQLAEVARRTGLPVEEVPGWRTRGHGPMSRITTVVPHHTAGPPTGDAPTLGVVTNGRAGLAGPLSHFVLGRSGKVYVVAAGLAWHAGSVRVASWGNPYAIGIEAEGTGYDSWSEQQLDAFARLCAELVKEFGLSASDVRAHKEICSPPGRKIDPNFDMPSFRVRVQRALNPPPTPIPKEAEMGSHPVSLDPTNEWRVLNFPVETGTVVVKDMWFTISSSFGATEYMLILEDGRGFLDQQSGTQTIGNWGKEVTAGSGTRQFHLLPRGVTTLSLRYRNIGGAVAGIAFPQTQP